jgi:nucleoside-diphosphate-sugar epimerase
MSVLVTGIGNVGIVTVEKFANEGYEVVIYDLNPTPSRVDPVLKELERENRKVKAVHGDITDFSRLYETVKQNEIEGIVHTVGVTHRAAAGNPYALHPSIQLGVNTGGTQNVLEVARVADLKRVIYTSSGACFGKIPPEVKTPLKEDYPVKMTFEASFYDVSKYMGELLTAGYHRVYGVDAATCRLSWVRGIAGFDPGGIGYYLEEVLKGNEIVEESGADVIADFSYNRDVAEGIFLLYTCKNLDTPPPNRLYHLSGGRLWKLGEIMSFINEIGPGHVTLGPGIAGKWQRLKDSIRHVPMDIERMRKLGYRPRSWKDAIADWAEWLKRPQKL